MNSLTLAARSVALAALVLLLAACGGGGGSSTAPGVPSADGGSVTGLIPAAAAPGPVLYQDAGALRPLTSGAVWTYSGTATNPISGDQPTYANTVSQQAAGSGVTESATNAFESGADSATITVDAAGVHSTEDVNLFNVSSTTLLSNLELRSPVRQNDQIKLLDQQQVDTGTDFDGDGTNDKADLAAYRVVVGNESVSLPGLAPVTALHVDLTIAMRVYASSTGQATPVLKFVESIWYAPGIGIVRQRLTAPTTTTATAVYDEVLTKWDGVTKGLGAMTMQRAVLPASAGSLAGDTSAIAVAALPFVDHVVVQTSYPSQAGRTSPGAYFEVLDLRGNVTSFVAYDGLTSLWNSKMMPTSQGFAVVSRVSQAGQGTLAIFDAQARLLSPASGVPYSVTTPGLIGEFEQQSQVAGDTTGWWIAWQRSYNDIGAGVEVNQVVARKFDYAGHPLTGVLVLAGLGFAETAEVSVDASEGNVLITWRPGDGPTRYVRMTGSPTAAPAELSFGTAGDGLSFLPLATSTAGSFAFTWATRTGSGLGNAQEFGVLLAADGQPILKSGSTGPAGEALGGSWPAGDQGAGWGADATGGLVAAGATMAPSGTLSYYVATVPSPSGALSAATPQFITFPRPPDFFYGGDIVIPVVFPDRVLVLASEQGSGTLATNVVWRQ